MVDKGTLFIFDRDNPDVKLFPLISQDLNAKVLNEMPKLTTGIDVYVTVTVTVTLVVAGTELAAIYTVAEFEVKAVATVLTVTPDAVIKGA